MPEVEPKEHTDVDGGASESSDGDVIDGVIPSAGHEEADVDETQQPCVAWGTSAVHDPIGHAFDSLNPTFSRVLLLLVRLTLPTADEQCTKYVQHLASNLSLGTI